MEEKDFKNIMQSSKLEIEFPDFEKQVMEKIRERESSRRSVWKNLKIAWIFFFVGTFMGIFVTQFLADIRLPFLGENSKLVLLLGQITIVFVVATQFDSLFRFTIKNRK